MYKLFTDKSEIFECNINLEGASLKDSQARLIIETEDLNLLFNGSITGDGKCTIPIRKLKGLLESNIEGQIKLEVIAEDTYFTPWSSKFQVQASKKLTVEVTSQHAQLIKEGAPKVQISGIKEQTLDPVSEHVLSLVNMLVKENVRLSNLSIKRDKFSNIVATYLKKNNIKDNQVQEIMSGVLTELKK